MSTYLPRSVYRLPRLAAAVVAYLMLCVPTPAWAADFEASTEYYRGYRDALRDIARVERWRSASGRTPSGFRRTWPDRPQTAASRDDLDSMSGRQLGRSGRPTEFGNDARQASAPLPEPGGRPPARAADTASSGPPPAAAREPITGPSALPDKIR